MSISILRLLSHENMNTNELIKQTSSDKSFVVNTIKALNKAKIIKRTRSHEHRQMKINELDHLGSELIKVISRIEQYSNAYKKFVNTYRENSWIDGKRSIQSPESSTNVINRHSKKDPKVLEQNKYVEEIEEVLEFCTRSIWNILIYIYAILYPISGGDKLFEAIVNNIILTSLSEQILFCRDDAKMVELCTNFIVPIIESLVGDNIGLSLCSNPLFGKEARNLILAFLRLIMINSAEETFSSFVNKYYPVYPEYPDFKPRGDVLYKYDTILKDLT